MDTSPHVSGSTDTDVVGALPPETELHEYRIVRVLGHGGFGITYLARDTQLSTVFAIKEFLPAELAARSDGMTVTVRSETSREHFDWAKMKFMKEAQVLARFSHPNLVGVSRLFEGNGTVYIVMEYVAGSTLSDLMQQEGPMAEDRIRQILQPVILALAEVHEAGILHRDIKPANIIVRPDGTPVLIDFGAARQSSGQVTKSLLNVLTAGYAPIEQYSQDMPQGPWTDIYALGAVAYRMMCGRKLADAVARLRDDPLEPAAEVGMKSCSPEFLAALDWALAVHPGDRPQSLADWRKALDGQLKPPAPSHRFESQSAKASTGGPDAIYTGATEPLSLPPTQVNFPQQAAVTRNWGRTVLSGLAGAIVAVSALFLIPRLAGDAAPIKIIVPGAAVVTQQPSSTANAGAPAAALDVVDVLAAVDQGEALIRAGDKAALQQLINARLAVSTQDPAGLLLTGHAAFDNGQREAGAQAYAAAFAILPRLADDKTVAFNLVDSLGWVTARAKPLILDYPTKAILAELARRSGADGVHGRNHAVHALQRLGRGDLVDWPAYARWELNERPECKDKKAIVRMLGASADRRVIPLLEQQIDGFFRNRCLRDDVKAAVRAIRQRSS